MKYLVSLASLYECSSLDMYVYSLKNLGKSVDKIISVEFHKYISDYYSFEGVPAVSVKIKDEVSYPGNLYRFAYFPMGMKKDDVCIFTDTHDVFFQTQLPKLDPKKIYVGSEHILWKDSEFWAPLLKEFNVTELYDKEIYCMGAWVMPFGKAYELMDFLRVNQGMFAKSNWSDQILFNLWLLTQKFETHPSLIANMFNGYNTKDILIKDKKIINKKGEEFCIAHFNGNTKKLYEFL